MPSDDPYAELNTYIGVGANQELATSLTAPLFCGWMLHVLLFGLVAQHAFNYRGSEAFKSEARGQRIIFGLVVGMDALASAVSFAQTMTYGTIQNRDVNTLLLGVNQPLDCLPFFLGGLVALIVQLSLAARAAKFFLGRDTLRKVFLWVVGVLAGIAWLGSVCVGFMYALFSAQPENPLVVNAFYFNIFICIWTSTSAAVDIIITVSLCQVLQSELRGWNLVTDGLLRKVIVLATETGAMTAVTAICAAILSVSFPSTNISKINICFVFAFPLPSLYALSYLCTLSGREKIRTSSLGNRASSGYRSPPASRRGSGVWITKEQVRRVEMTDGTVVGERRGNGRNVRVRTQDEAVTMSEYRVSLGDVGSSEPQLENLV